MSRTKIGEELAKARKVEHIRVFKAMQTETLQQRGYLVGLHHILDQADEKLHDEVLDAVKTASDHRDALGHIIKRLEIQE